MGSAPRELRGDPAYGPSALHDRERIHAAAVRGLAALHADVTAWTVHHGIDAAPAGAGQDPPDVSRGGDRLWHGRPRDDVDRQHANGHNEHDRDVEAPRAVAGWPDDREASGRDGRATAISGLSECLDPADPQPARHAPDGYQDAGRDQDSRFGFERNPAARRGDRAKP